MTSQYNAQHFKWLTNLCQEHHLVSAHLSSGMLCHAGCAVKFQGTNEEEKNMNKEPMCVSSTGRACTERPVPRAASTMAPMEGRWPPGKMCSRMKSEDAQYAS